MKGKIIAISPKVIGDTQETFPSKEGKIMYVFIVSAEIDGNIQIGDANSTFSQPKWKLNEECEITVEKNDKATGGNKFRFSFGDFQQRSSAGSGGKTGYSKTTSERAEIISQNAFSTAIRYIQALEPEERKALLDKYGPDDSFINFATRISDEIVKNAKRLESGALA